MNNKHKEFLYSIQKGEFEIQTFRAGGKGGQNQNKRDTGVRIIHPASGAVGESREERSQLQNKKIAFERLCHSPKFTAWNYKKAQQFMGNIKSPEQIKQEVEDRITRDLANGNIKIEYVEPE